MFVQGPYLVRAAEITGDVLSLQGDSDTDTQIDIFTNNKVSSVTWNGKNIEVKKTREGSLRGMIDGPGEFKAPQFGTWKIHDGLPERLTSYSDSSIAWANADHMETPNPNKNATKPYLYGDEYGFHHGIKLWRGRFHGSASGIFITSQGGYSHGWSAFLNGHFVGSFMGSLEENSSSREIEFPLDTVFADGENILLIVQDNAGHDQLRASINPRGILNATLYDNEDGFGSWKVAGTAGGAVGIEIDPVRTGYSQGGLAAERLGWHLPGFDDSSWTEGSPSDGSSDAGVRYYRTVLPLNVPDGHDVALSVRLSPHEDAHDHFRAYVFVNGYQYGKYFPYFAKERSTFPVPPGIWDYNGDNVVGIAVWNQQNDIVKLDASVDVDYVLASSLDVKFDGTYLRPSWDTERSEYV